MKDYSNDQLERGYEHLNALDTVGFCLNQLFADCEHRMTDSIVQHLTFEELIGALLAARKEITDLQAQMEEINESSDPAI